MFRVRALPKPDIFWGNVADGGRGQKQNTRLFARYPPEIPLNATFQIVSWKCIVPGQRSRPKEGTGSNISSARTSINQALPGSTVTFMCVVLGPDGVRKKKSATFSI